MSLRDSYFSGPSGLQMQMDAAFANGIAYIGTGASDSSTLSLGDRNGSNLGAGTGVAGFYFTYASTTANYAFYMVVSGEVAPAGAFTAIPVVLTSGDNSTVVATKIAAAMNAVLNTPFSATSTASVVSMTNNTAGMVIVPVSAGTLGGTAAVAQATAGIAPTGNYTALQNGLAAAAAGGQQDFRIVCQGTGSMNSVTLRACNGNNLALRSFFAGIYQALATQQIYNYQVQLYLDISTNSGTNVIFKFGFGRRFQNAPVNLDPLSCATNGFIGSCGSGHMSGGSCGCGY